MGKDDYVAQYYVNLFEGQEQSKNYRVVADIHRTYKRYYILNAMLPDGGYIVFEDYYINSDLVPYDKIRVIDDDEKEWWVELTKERP